MINNWTWIEIFPNMWLKSNVISGVKYICEDIEMNNYSAGFLIGIMYLKCYEPPMNEDALSKVKNWCETNKELLQKCENNSNMIKLENDMYLEKLKSLKN